MTQRRLGDYSDSELAALRNEEMLAVVEAELAVISDDPSKQKECRELKEVVSDIKNGNYLNPFGYESLPNDMRSEIQAVRSARVITGVLELLNKGLTILIALAGTMAWIIMANNYQAREGFIAFLVFLIGSVISYYLIKLFYVALELLATIADDTRKIRRLHKNTTSL